MHDAPVEAIVKRIFYIEIVHICHLPWSYHYALFLLQSIINTNIWLVTLQDSTWPFTMAKKPDLLAIHSKRSSPKLPKLPNIRSSKNSFASSEGREGTCPTWYLVSNIACEKWPHPDFFNVFSVDVYSSLTLTLERTRSACGEACCPISSACIHSSCRQNQECTLDGACVCSSGLASHCWGFPRSLSDQRWIPDIHMERRHPEGTDWIDQRA